MNQTIKGTIIFIGEVESFTGKNFKKRSCIIRPEGNPIAFQIDFAQDFVSLLDNFNIGEKVIVSAILESRKWVNPQGITKYFLSLTGWEIQLV